VGHRSVVAALGGEQGLAAVGLWSQLWLERKAQADWKLVSVAVESTLAVAMDTLAVAAAAAAAAVDTGDEGPAVVPVEQGLEGRKEKNLECVFVKVVAAASSVGVGVRDVGVRVVPYRGLAPLRAKRGDQVLGEARPEQPWAVVY